jgi:hypothetical protein
MGGARNMRRGIHIGFCLWGGGGNLEWIHLAQARDRLRVIVNKVMILRVP